MKLKIDPSILPDPARILMIENLPRNLVLPYAIASPTQPIRPVDKINGKACYRINPERNIKSSNIIIHLMISS